MKLRGFSVILCAALLATGAVQANSDGSAGMPAELPPASFTGKQFVDSDGCVFVRAGLGGDVTWVPRVSRDRTQVCGMKPTFAATTPAPSPVAPTTKPKSRPEPAAVAAAAPTPKPKAALVRTASVTPAPKKTVARPAPVTRAAATPKPRTVLITGKIVCRDQRGVRRTYSYTIPDGQTVQCNPQDTGAPVLVSGQQVTAAAVTKPVYRMPAPVKGYKYAFEDDRLNPNRGERTAAGTAAMNQIWTQEVPRRLVSPSAGLEVRGASNVATPKGYRASSKSVATAPTHHRYVQVGTFGAPSNASGAAAKLKRMGLPVRTANTKTGGKTLKVVLAGPFKTEAEMQRALGAARKSGFKDAFPRN